MLSIVLIIALISCKNEKSIAPEIKIAKTVPLHFINAHDSALFNHGDTVYYNKQFFTGFSYSLYPTGDTEFVHSYFNGVEEGEQRDWYDNKQLSLKTFYINGQRQGRQQGWWPAGNPKFSDSTIDDKFEGEAREWNRAGLLYKLFHYKNGNEEGSERLWWDNGTVRANYVVRDGKKYGLIGLMLCANPYDSINKK